MPPYLLSWVQRLVLTAFIQQLVVKVFHQEVHGVPWNPVSLSINIVFAVLVKLAIIELEFTINNDLVN